MQARSGDLISGGPSSRLSELGIVVPAPPAPLGAYVESSDTGNLLFLSGTLPVVNGKLAIAGRLGANLSVKEGQEAARIASLNALAAAKQHLGGSSNQDHSLFPLRRKVSTCSSTKLWFLQADAEPSSWIEGRPAMCARGRRSCHVAKRRINPRLLAFRRSESSLREGIFRHLRF